MSENQGQHVLAKKDFVDVVNEAGDVVGSVPKHWGNDQLAPGLKKKSRAGSTPAVSKPDAEPAGNASAEVWAAYAREHKGAQDADLLDDQGEALGRDELRAKFGTHTGS